MADDIGSIYATALKNAHAVEAAGEDGRVRGDHPGYVIRRSVVYTRASLHPAATALVAAAPALADRSSQR